MVKTMRKKARNTHVLIAVGLLALGLTAVLEWTHPTGQPIHWVIRGLALLGYQFVFLSILSSASLPQLVRFFGRPFIKVHHGLSITGLALITLHPLAVALSSGTPLVFLPRFDSLRVFLTLGGRPAWYLIAAATLAAVLRQPIGKSWKLLHFLNYLAFFLSTAHANLIGTNFQDLPVRVVSIGMALVVGAVFVRRRWPSARRRARAS